MEINYYYVLKEPHLPLQRGSPEGDASSNFVKIVEAEKQLFQDLTWEAHFPSIEHGHCVLEQTTATMPLAPMARTTATTPRDTKRPVERQAYECSYYTVLS